MRTVRSMAFVLLLVLSMFSFVCRTPFNTIFSALCFPSKSFGQNEKVRVNGSDRREKVRKQCMKREGKNKNTQKIWKHPQAEHELMWLSCVLTWEKQIKATAATGAKAQKKMCVVVILTAVAYANDSISTNSYSLTHSLPTHVEMPKHNITALR